jgi:hypothetical protein
MVSESSPAIAIRVNRVQRENGRHGNTPYGSGGFNREPEVAEATGIAYAR